MLHWTERPYTSVLKSAPLFLFFIIIIAFIITDDYINILSISAIMIHEEIIIHLARFVK